MIDKTKQEQIHKALWSACDTFRGAIDPSEYKNYILVFLFLKYISDVWQEHYNQYKRQNLSEERIQSKMSRERFILPQETSFYDLFEKRNNDNIGEEINKALDKIEDANNPKLNGVFRNIDFNSESNLGKTKDRQRRLKNIFEDFNKAELDFSPSKISEDVIGESYIYLISKFASNSGKKAGEFFTPRSISTLLAKLAHPQEGARICDPACGSGSLLITAANEVGSNNYSLFGQESTGATYSLARMNMFLHGIDSAKIEWCDTLNNPQLIEYDKLMQFDIVVANPPFSLDKWGEENAKGDKFNRFFRGVPPKSKGDFAFISHMIETAKRESGRVAVIVPHGVLFRGSSEGKIRESLIKENLLDAVVALPPQLFQSTGIPVAILLFDRSRELGGRNQDRKDVVFIDASREFQAGKNQNKLRDEDVAKIVDTYRNRKAIDKYSHIASLEEIEKNDYNLNIPRYVKTFDQEEEIDLKTAVAEVKQLEKELSAVQTQMDGFLNELGYEK
jgi:type I restriction enzyme M protein